MLLFKWLFKPLIMGCMVSDSIRRRLMSGRVESTYEPAMTKAFLHGRTESIRTVQPESFHFVKVSVLQARC